MGRPVKYTPEVIEELKTKFEEYYKNTNIPIIKEFCARNDISFQRLYEFEEFSESIKKCIEKKEADLERSALLGTVDKTMAIFSLKQLGWKDQQDIRAEISANAEVIIK